MMNRKAPACAVLLALPLMALGSASAPEAAGLGIEEAVALYRRSPREVHRLLKARYEAGQPVEALVRAIEQDTGDFSFATFGSKTPGIRDGMGLQTGAHRAWEEGDREAALALFAAARQRFPQEAGFSERAFCSYFRAEILSESGKHRQSLEEAGRAMEELGERPVPYLAALLQQSRGFPRALPPSVPPWKSGCKSPAKRGSLRPGTTWPPSMRNWVSPTGHWPATWNPWACFGTRRPRR